MDTFIYIMRYKFDAVLLALILFIVGISCISASGVFARKPIKRKVRK